MTVGGSLFGEPEQTKKTKKATTDTVRRINDAAEPADTAATPRPV